eukprot:TRINITY_DN830_c1_g1_i1.p1 TRINITY_DN830_c1_g1~~TRINITY_DN830_c1_g1_i1.p1  ORF type:complete len:173 (-),score=19.72 TRINITY_DN830_c1_g1_i1:363-881(-)
MVRRRVTDANGYFDRVVMSLSDHETPDNSSVDGELVAEALKIDPTLDEDTVRRLASVFWHNSFPEGVFPDAARFNHACDANCAYTMEWDANAAFVVRTIRPVLRGGRVVPQLPRDGGGPLPSAAGDPPPRLAVLVPMPALPRGPASPRPLRPSTDAAPVATPPPPAAPTATR